MREMLPTRHWPIPADDRAWHFIEAHKICYENRNKLMHSNLMSGSDRAIVLYKIGRDGKSTLTNPTLSELRQVADDMNKLFDYGLWLSNMINMNLLGQMPPAGDIASWPDKPPLPIPLEYTADPTPIRGPE
jgi:hypothetical protein